MSNRGLIDTLINKIDESSCDTTCKNVRNNLKKRNHIFIPCYRFFLNIRIKKNIVRKLYSEHDANTFYRCCHLQIKTRNNTSTKITGLLGLRHG